MGRKKSLKRIVQEGRAWAEAEQDLFRDNRIYQRARSEEEAREYARRGLIYVCGATPEDITYPLYAEKREELEQRYGIDHLEEKPLFSPEGIMISPGNITIIEGKGVEHYLLEEARCSPNMAMERIPTVMSPYYEGLEFKARLAYLAVLKIVDPKKFLAHFDRPAQPIIGPDGIVLEPTIISSPSLLGQMEEEWIDEEDWDGEDEGEEWKR